jgi:hypothetical protein
VALDQQSDGWRIEQATERCLDRWSPGFEDARQIADGDGTISGEQQRHDVTS